MTQITPDLSDEAICSMTSGERDRYYAAILVRCDRCGATMAYEDAANDIQEDLWLREIYFGRPKPSFLTNGNDFCKACAKVMTPWVYTLRDVQECLTFVNRLEKTIREHRTAYNRTTSDPSGKRCESCGARLDGHTSSGSAPQARKEHHRVALLRDKDRDVSP